jgi:hypothetical protein
MKIAVCFSSGGMVMASFAVCVAALVAQTAMAGVPLTIINAESSLNMVNRDYAVREARKQGCSHVFFIDSDMVFPSDALLRLIDADRAIVGALYARRVYPHATLGSLIDPADTRDIAEAHEMGLGLILIRLEVFDAMEAPHFRCPAVASDTAQELSGFDLTGIEAGDTIDDSIWFSKAARRAGFELWVDRPLTLSVGHTGFTTHYVARPATRSAEV